MLFTAALLILVVFGWLAFVKPPVPPLPQQQKLDSLTTLLSTSKTVAATTQYATKEASLAERKAAQRLATRVGLLRDSLAVVREAMRSEQEDVGQLQAALLTATQEAESTATAARLYLDAVDTLRAKYAEERRAMTVALERADSVIGQQQVVIRTLHEQRCKLFGRACPSRVTVAGVTAIVLTTLWVAR